MRRSIIIIVTLAAVGAILYFKSIRKDEIINTAVSQKQTQNKMIFYLFHDPSDQDAECKKIYSFADRAEHELSESIVVRRPDVEQDKDLMTRYNIKILPTIIIVAPGGEEEERFEGEGNSVEVALEKTMIRLRGK